MSEIETPPTITDRLSYMAGACASTAGLAQPGSALLHGVLSVMMVVFVLGACLLPPEGQDK